MKIHHYIIFLIILSLCNNIRSQDQSSNKKFVYLIENQSTKSFIGIEYAELTQNKFRDIGPRNFTFLVGQRFSKTAWNNLGWRYMIIDAELSEEHIRNVNQVGWIEGNRENLTGDVHAQRLGLDFFPISLGIGYIKKWNRHILEVHPVVYGALGYNNWGFTNTVYNESYRLKALSLGGGVRLQSVLFETIFIENPLMDIFTYLVKNRSVYGEIGDTKITRPEHIGMFSWATLGIRLEF